MKHDMGRLKYKGVLYPIVDNWFNRGEDSIHITAKREDGSCFLVIADRTHSAVIDNGIVYFADEQEAYDIPVINADGFPIEGRPTENSALILRDILSDPELMNLPADCLDEAAIARAAELADAPYRGKL